MWSDGPNHRAKIKLTCRSVGHHYIVPVPNELLSTLPGLFLYLLFNSQNGTNCSEHDKYENRNSEDKGTSSQTCLKNCIQLFLCLEDRVLKCPASSWKEALSLSLSLALISFSLFFLGGWGHIQRFLRVILDSAIRNHSRQWWGNHMRYQG